MHINAPSFSSNMGSPAGFPYRVSLQGFPVYQKLELRDWPLYQFNFRCNLHYLLVYCIYAAILIFRQ